MFMHHWLWAFINIFNTLSVPNLKVHADSEEVKHQNLHLHVETQCAILHLPSVHFLQLYLRIAL